MSAQRRTRKGKHKEVTSKAKMRTVIRKVVENMWVKDILSDLKNPSEEEFNMDPNENMLSSNQKLELMTSIDQRDNEVIQEIAKNLSYLLPFAKYSLEWIEKLVLTSFLKGYNRGRVLFKLGDESLYAYFILRGVVNIIPEEVDLIKVGVQFLDNEEVKNKILTASHIKYDRGQIIGREELLFGKRREHRAEILEDLLCIQFSKKHMVTILQPMLDGWHEVSQYLAKYHIFDYLNIRVLKELSKLGNLVTVRSMKIIDAEKTTNFLIDGEISVIQRLLVERRDGYRNVIHLLYHDQNATEFADNVYPIYMQAGNLIGGALFGVGERMSHFTFWTRKACKIITFDKNEVLKYGDSEIWNTKRKLMNKLFPSTEELFRHYVNSKQWLSYKKEVNAQINRKAKPATIHDVPIPMRFKHAKMKRSFVKKLAKMEDYLKGGPCPLIDEISFSYSLDKDGDKREAMFGKLKTDHGLFEHEKEEEEKEEPRDNYPSFFFYKDDDLLKL